MDRKATWGFMAGALVGAALTSLVVVAAFLALDLDVGTWRGVDRGEVAITPAPTPADVEEVEEAQEIEEPEPCAPLLAERPPWWPTDDTAAKELRLAKPSKPLERRMKFWEALWGKHGDHVYMFADKRRPSLLHAVVDCRDLYGPGINPAAAEKRCDRRLIAKKKQVRKSLYRQRRRPSRALRRALDNDKRLIRSAYNQIYVIEGKADALKEAVTRASQHLATLEKVFASVGVPPALTRLSFIESLFQPGVESHAGAVGAFQFVAATGRQWLMIGDGVDERMDPERSGWASAQYLKTLYRGFDDWGLALTAYNTGPTRMRRIVKKHRTRDIGAIADMRTERAFGFDGQNYYAQLAAVVRITEEIEPLEVLLERQVVKLPEPLPLREVARCSEVPAVVIAKMNPALGSDIVEGKKPIPKGYFVNLPVDSKAEVRAPDPAPSGEQPS